VLGQLRWSAGCLEATCPDRLRPELYFAVGDLANTAGYMALDAGADEQARRIFSFALYCAEQAKDWPLRAEVLGYMTVHAIWTGQPDEGLTLAEQALVRQDRLTATQRSMLHTDRASALAKMRRIQEALTALGTADDHFAQFTPANAPPFLAYHNPAVHALRTGQTLGKLAILGHNPGEATDRLTTAAAGLTGHAQAPGRMPGQAGQPHDGHRLTRSRPWPSDPRHWTPPARSAPARPSTTCVSCPATPPRTSSSRRSPTCGTGSPPWCAPILRSNPPPTIPPSTIA
jgi:hypothetical protein